MPGDGSGWPKECMNIDRESVKPQEQSTSPPDQFETTGGNG